MSDETRSGQPLKLQVIQVVNRDSVSKMYHVVELTEKGWVTISKGYRHSTSCYAHLGRLVSQRNK